jgi:hypothetical protein
MTNPYKSPIQVANASGHKPEVMLNLVFAVMVATFLGWFVADYRQWQTYADDAGMNVWGEIKVCCLVANFIAWGGVAGLVYFRRPMADNWRARRLRMLILSAWMLNGFCLGIFFIGLLAFLF